MRLAGDTLDTLLLRTRVDAGVINRSLLYGGNEPRPSKAVFVHIKYLYKTEGKFRALNLMRSFVKE